MHLQKIILRHFRNYTHAEVEFSRGINFIYGDNGQGKTNLLEALHLLTTARSFRTRCLTDLIQVDQTDFYIEAHFVKHDIAQTLKLFYDRTHRIVTHNHTTYSALTSLLGVIQGITLTPGDQMLIKGAPALRRRFLDMQIAQIDPCYVEQLLRYLNAMQQRNALLRQKSVQHIEIWEEQMATAAAYLIQKRAKIVLQLQEKVQQLQALPLQIADQIELKYYNSALQQVQPHEIKAYLLARWQQIRPRELIMGTTLSGPHKDDLMITINEREAQSFASEGQQRQCVAILRLAQWHHLAENAATKPLLAVDDVGLSLDTHRQKKLLELLFSTQAQLFLTAPNCLFLPQSPNNIRYRIVEGTITAMALDSM